MRKMPYQVEVTENVQLIESLEKTKAIADDLVLRSEQATKIQTSIKATSEKYRSVANRSSLLFFLMSDLNKIHRWVERPTES